MLWSPLWAGTDYTSHDALWFPLLLSLSNASWESHCQSASGTRSAGWRAWPLEETAASKLQLLPRSIVVAFINIFLFLGVWVF